MPVNEGAYDSVLRRLLRDGVDSTITLNTLRHEAAKVLNVNDAELKPLDSVVFAAIQRAQLVKNDRSSSEPPRSPSWFRRSSSRQLRSSSGLHDQDSSVLYWVSSRLEDEESSTGTRTDSIPVGYWLQGLAPPTTTTEQADIGRYLLTPRDTEDNDEVHSGIAMKKVTPRTSVIARTLSVISRSAQDLAVSRVCRFSSRRAGWTESPEPVPEIRNSGRSCNAAEVDP